MKGGWTTPRPCRFTPGKDPVPIAQEVLWAPGPVRTYAENLASTKNRTLDGRYTDCAIAVRRAEHVAGIKVVLKLSLENLTRR